MFLATATLISNKRCLILPLIYKIISLGRNNADCLSCAYWLFTYLSIVYTESQACIFAFFTSMYFLIFLVFSDFTFFFLLFDPLLVCVWISKYLWIFQFSFYLPTTGDVRDAGSIPGSERSPGGENGNPLQYSCLGNPMDRGALRSTVHGVSKSQTQQRLSMYWLLVSLQSDWKRYFVWHQSSSFLIQEDMFCDLTHCFFWQMLS